MEPVSLGVSVVALASLFDTALNCFKHVKIGKSFGTDLQTSLLKLRNLHLRLSRWGEAVGLDKDVITTGELKATTLSADKVKEAEELVGQVINLFSKADELALKSQGKPGQFEAVDVDDEVSGDVAKLCKRMFDICVRRQRNTSTAKKAKWALYNKEKLAELIDGLQSLISDLVDLYSKETHVELERNLCDDEATELRDERALPALQEVARAQDIQLAEAIARLERNVGTRALNATINCTDSSQFAQKSTTFNTRDSKVMNMAGEIHMRDQNVTF